MTNPHSKSEEHKHEWDEEGSCRICGIDYYDINASGVIMKEEQVGKVKSTYKICENDFSIQPALNQMQDKKLNQIKEEVLTPEEILEIVKNNLPSGHPQVTNIITTDKIIRAVKQAIQKTKEYYEKEIASLKRQIDMLDNLNIEQDEDFEQKQKEFLDKINNKSMFRYTKHSSKVVDEIQQIFNEVFEKWQK